MESGEHTIPENITEKSEKPMTVMPFTKIRKYVLYLIVVILIGGIGYRLGEARIFSGESRSSVSSIVTNKLTPTSAGIDFGLFWDVWQRLFRYHIDAAKFDKQKMVWGAINGMVASIDDPYTSFLPPKENKEFKEDLGGSFEGIGAQLGMKDSLIIVVAPLKGNPAEKAGIKPGDYILKVNDEDTYGWTLNQAVAKIRGPKGTTVKLSILHEGDKKPTEMNIVRDSINVPSVDAWIKPANDITEVKGATQSASYRNSTTNIAYIHLSRFGDNTNDEWNKAVADILKAQKSGSVHGLVLDLRNNPGGYLQGAVFIGSEFIDSGIVVSQMNSDGSKEDYQIDRRGRLLTIPIVVLINKGSASASEIVSGALRDHKRATLVGETSYGKGTVQTPQDLSGGAGVHITTGRWLLPSGASISNKGLSPDIVVTDGYEEATADAQLARGIEVLLSK